LLFYDKVPTWRSYGLIRALSVSLPKIISVPHSREGARARFLLLLFKTDLKEKTVTRKQKKTGTTLSLVCYILTK
jgi:hypothetical protein